MRVRRVVNNGVSLKSLFFSRRSRRAPVTSTQSKRAPVTDASLGGTSPGSGRGYM